MRSVGQVLAGRAVLVAWIGAAVALFGAAAAAGLVVSHAGLDTVPWKSVLVPVVWAVPGALLAAGRPRLPVGWLLLAVSLLFVGVGACGAWVQVRLGAPVPSLAGVDWAVWFADRCAALIAVLGLLLLLLLPDGRLPTPRWKPWVAVLVVAQTLVLVAFCLVRGPAAGPDGEWPGAAGAVANPVGLLPGWVGAMLDGADVWLLQLPLLLVPFAFAVKVRRATGDERTRIVGVLLAGTTFALLVVLGHAFWPAATDVLDVVGSALLAVVLTGSLLRRRLPQIDYAVHHGFVYAVLTLTIALVYVVVSSSAARLGHELPPFAAGVVAGVMALALLPLRGWLQRQVGRWLHGDRGDPFMAVSRLAARAHDAATLDAVLTQVASTVGRSLRAQWVQIEVPGAVVETGHRPPGAASASVPLLAGERVMGRLSLGVGPGRTLQADELRLLAELGRHGGVVVHAVTLAHELRHSRQRLVESREEERRRLGRDLHDDLGPTIAGLAMQIGTVRGIVRSDPETACDRLGRLEDSARGALSQVRRVARELRPTALDQSGLVDALRQVGEGLGLDARVAGPSDLDLPAAVELAAYRIASEALTNVARHTERRHAGVEVVLDHGVLTLEVTDGGPGWDDDARHGIGLPAMRERAEEVGGSCTVVSGLAGTTVSVRLPVGPGVVVAPA